MDNKNTHQLDLKVESNDTIHEELRKGVELSIIRLIDCLVEKAHRIRASDIHIIPDEDKVRIRIRVDGVLQDAYEFPKSIHHEIISRIKILSGLRTDEHQAAQDGRFRVSNSNSNFGNLDVRVSIAPTYHGENAVLRLLSNQADEQHTLEALGFSKPNCEKIINAIQKPYGMILATGPTGSGKTTTLYTILKMLNKKEISIITVEDPIEYAVDGVEQIQVNHRTGLNFANGLRSILRQDPDVIMVGEIRDQETGALAVNTALTGHLLLSTLHTNDAATTLPRLLDMKIESYLVASTVNLAIGQRLVRKICEDCRKERKLTEAEHKSISDALSGISIPYDMAIYKGYGCESCNGTGYKGRIGIHEILVMDDDIREAILKKVSASDIKQIAKINGMTSMIEDGFDKVKDGITTIEEILRVIHE